MHLVTIIYIYISNIYDSVDINLFGLQITLNGLQITYIEEDNNWVSKQNIKVYDEVYSANEYYLDEVSQGEKLLLLQQRDATLITRRKEYPDRFKNFKKKNFIEFLNLSGYSFLLVINKG